MDRLCVLLLLLVFVSAIEAHAIIFPGQAAYAEGEPCRTRSGGPGTCSRSCEHSSTFEEPPTCGNTESPNPLVCCHTTSDVSPQNLDISPPSVTFDCSSSRPQLIGTPHNGSPAITHKPVGGGKVAIVGTSPQNITWPWMALIGTRVGEGIAWQCTGMLINEQWVLSHGICFLADQQRVVRLGEYDYNDDLDGAAHQDFEVAETVLYPGYASHLLAYDGLALIRLSSTVKLQKYISPVCLPWGREGKEDITGHRAKVLSFGNDFQSDNSNSIQREVEVTVFPVAQCDRSYSRLPSYNKSWPRGMGQETLCAGHPAGGRDACKGDSGGPLVSQDSVGRYVVAGIVSQGYGCGLKEYPGLYINLRYSPYLAWIKKVAFATP